MAWLWITLSSKNGLPRRQEMPRHCHVDATYVMCHLQHWIIVPKCVGWPKPPVWDCSRKGRQVDVVEILCVCCRCRRLYSWGGSRACNRIQGHVKHPSFHSFIIAVVHDAHTSTQQIIISHQRTYNLLAMVGKHQRLVCILHIRNTYIRNIPLYSGSVTYLKYYYYIIRKLFFIATKHVPN